MRIYVYNYLAFLHLIYNAAVLLPSATWWRVARDECFCLDATVTHFKPNCLGERR